MKETNKKTSTTPSIPSMTSEGRENKLVSLATELAEQQLREGTASSQVITHFLKLGSTKNELEKEQLRNQNELLKAKVGAIEDAKRIEELYTNALNAMKHYGGHNHEISE